MNGSCWPDSSTSPNDPIPFKNYKRELPIYYVPKNDDASSSYVGLLFVNLGVLRLSQCMVEAAPIYGWLGYAKMSNKNNRRHRDTAGAGLTLPNITNSWLHALGSVLSTRIDLQMCQLCPQYPHQTFFYFWLQYITIIFVQNETIS